MNEKDRKLHTCCFFGHRKIEATAKIINNLKEIVERLIAEEKVDTFLFGSKSHITDYQPKSGTRIAFEYAKKKECSIINS